MKTGVWILIGLALTGLATLLSQSETAGSGMDFGLSGYLPILVIGTIGQYCFWRAFRSAIGDVWSLTKSPNRKGGSPPPSPGTSASSGPGDLPTLSDFDADEAFARYMARRDAKTEAAPTVASIGTIPRTTRARTQRRFGRKVV